LPPAIPPTASIAVGSGGRTQSQCVSETLTHTSISVISTDDGVRGRVAQLFRDIGAIVARRKINGGANVTSLYEYNGFHLTTHSRLVIVIDNFVESSIAGRLTMSSINLDPRR
jgi:hypothetical protein